MTLFPNSMVWLSRRMGWAGKLGISSFALLGFWDAEVAPPPIANPVAPPVVERPTPETPVILIVIDTLRADHLGTYGYPLDTSPIIDEFAAHATVFENNSTQVNVTHSSLTSILSGLYARTHRHYTPIATGAKISGVKEFLVLPELFSNLNYHTLGIVSHPSWNTSQSSPLQRGWNGFSLIDEKANSGRRRRLANGRHTNERAFGLLSSYTEHHAEDPLFLWAHYFDPHTDLKSLGYNAPPETRNLFLKHHLAQFGLGAFEARLRPLDPLRREGWIPKNTEGEERDQLRLANGRSLYDAKIRSCDGHVGKMFEQLREMDLFDRALIIVMADHGENMEAESSMRGKIMFTHRRLFQGVTRTPLIVKLPGQTTGKRIASLTQNIDVFPTILEALGLPIPPQAEGKSLLPLWEDTSIALHKSVYIESSDHTERAIETKAVKYIEPGNGLAPLAFRLADDPGEMENVVESLDPEWAAGAHKALLKFAPNPKLHIRFEPEPEPYRLTFDVALTDAEFKEFEGPANAVTSEDGQRISWSGTVESDPIEFAFQRSHGKTATLWTISRDDIDRVDSRLFVGSRKLWNSGAFPAYSATDGQAPEDPLLRLTFEPAEDLFTAAVQLADPSRLDLILHAARPTHLFELEVQTRSGFDSDQVEPGRSQRFRAKSSSSASIAVRIKPTGTELRALCRINGAWPDPRSVALNGHAVNSDGVHFVFPPPPMRELHNALQSYDHSAAPVPGRITVWESGFAAETEIDTSEMDEDTIEGLRALGYVK